jgi:hypothetical protein
MNRKLYPHFIAGLLGLAILVPVPALAAVMVDNISITQMDFGNDSNEGNAADPFPAGETRPPNFLGGQSDQCPLGTDCDDERRQALQTIPSLFDYAYWDPSGKGNDYDLGIPGVPAFSYHDGRQYAWETHFSTPSPVDEGPPNGTQGTISPANLLDLGAKWNLSTGDFVAESGQGQFRMTASGAVGLRVDESAGPGGRFTLQMEIPVGSYRVSLFQENRTYDTDMTIDFPGVPQIHIPAISSGVDEFALQFDVTNNSGTPYTLTYQIGDLGNDETGDGDYDVRFSAAVIQTLPIVPEPGSLALAGMVTLGLLARRRR